MSTHPLPFYLITFRYEGGVYTHETRVDAPDSWQQLIDAVWQGQYDDIERVQKITPSASIFDLTLGTTEDMTIRLANEVERRSFDLGERPGREARKFLGECGKGWFEPETGAEADLRAWVSGRAA